MPDVLDLDAQQGQAALVSPGAPPVVPPVPDTAVDERPARRALLHQIAKLESELGALFCSAYPRQGFEWDVSSRGGPRVLPMEDLEALRDDLARRLDHNRRVLGDRTYVEELNRRRIEEMLLEPEKHRWVRVGNEDIGEPGCKHWHVRPRFGLLGMLMNWWRVRISSGCPLAKHPARPGAHDSISAKHPAWPGAHDSI